MNYASTRTVDGVETVIVVLPKSSVPKWNSESAQPGTYLVPDNVQPGWVRSSLDGSFVPPPRLTKGQMWERIKKERDRRSDHGGFPVQINGVTKWFHSDAKSRTQQIGMVMMGTGLPSGIQWKTMDGSFITMTAQIAQDIFQSGAAQDQATFSAAEQHRVAMEASQEPWTYNFSMGWPDIYGE